MSYELRHSSGETMTGMCGSRHAMGSGVRSD
jgi:hypothetical protein